jgi:hypothetical protein
MTPEQRAENLERMLVEFETAHPAGGRNLRALLGNTPELNTRVLEAIGAGNLQHFEALSPERRSSGAIGAYSPTLNTMRLPLDLLEVAATDPVAANRVRITLGHEIEHAVNKADVVSSREAFETQVRGIAAGTSPHDYTEAVGARNGSMREREARDEIAGVNVLAASVRRSNPDATLEDMYLASPRDMRAYITEDLSASPPTYAARAGLRFNTDLSLTPDAHNVERMAQAFYDPGYPARYGTQMLAKINEIETETQANARRLDPTGYTPPEVRVDLNRAGIAGAIVPAGITDTSVRRLEPEEPSPRSRAAVSEMDATPLYTHAAPATSAPASAHATQDSQAPYSSSDITDPQHPGRLRFQQAIHAIEHSPNISPGTFTGERLHQAAANLAYASLAAEERPGIGGRNEALSRIDFAVFNKDRSAVIGGEGELGNAAAKLAWLPGTQDNSNALSATSQRMHDLLQDPQKLALANPDTRQGMVQGSVEQEAIGPRR